MMKYFSATHNVQENEFLNRLCFIFIKYVQPGTLTCLTLQYGRVCGMWPRPLAMRKPPGTVSRTKQGDLARIDSPEKYGLFQQFVQCMSYVYLYPL